MRCRYIGVLFVRNMIFCYKEKVQIVHTNSKSSVRDEAQKCESAWEIKRGRSGDWHIPGTVVSKCEKSQHFTSVVMKTVAVVRACICWRSTVQSAMSPTAKNLNAYHVGTFANVLLWEVLPIDYFHVICVFGEPQKETRSIRPKTVQYLADKKKRLQTLKMTKDSNSLFEITTSAGFLRS